MDQVMATPWPPKVSKVCMVGCLGKFENSKKFSLFMALFSFNNIISCINYCIIEHGLLSLHLISVCPTVPNLLPPIPSTQSNDEASKIFAPLLPTRYNPRIRPSRQVSGDEGSKYHVVEYHVVEYHVFKYHRSLKE